MTLCRRFNGAPIMRVIVSVPADTVAEVDRLAQDARLCRAEFVRLAIAEKLDLMISRASGGDDAQDAVTGADGGVSGAETHGRTAYVSST